MLESVQVCSTLGVRDPPAHMDVGPSARPRADHAGVEPTAQDEPLLALLARDGRASYAELAAQTGDTETRVARRLDALLQSGAVIVDLEIANDLLGLSTSAWLWLTVAPSKLEEIGVQISGHPEVPFVAACSGPANLAVSVISRDTAALYGYLTHRIGAIDAIQSVEVAPILRRFKQAGTLTDGFRLPPPV